MKIFSIFYQSNLHPERIAISTAIDSDIDSAITHGAERIKREQGDLDWKHGIVNVMELNLPEVNIEEIKASKNWVFKTIIEKRDLALYNSMKKHMTDYEKEYIAERFIIKNNKNENRII